MPTSRLAIRAFYFLSVGSMGVFLPFLPAWLEARGIDGWGIGFISALRPLAGILVPVAFGLLADSFRLRGSLLRIAVLATVLSIVAIVLAVWRGNPGVGSLAVLFGVLALVRAPVSTLADVAALEEGTTSFGSLRLWGSLGFLLSALAAGHLLDPRAALPLPVAMGTLLLLAWFVALALPARARLPAQPIWSAARTLLASTDYQLYLLAVFFWLAAHSAYDLWFTLHLEGLGASTAFAGVAWALGTLAEVVVMGWAARLIRRHGSLRMMWLGVGISVLRWALLATVRSPAVLLPLQLLHAGSFGLVFVAALDFLRERVEPHVIATAQASFSVAGSLGAGMGTLVWGGLYATCGGSAVFGVAAVVAAASGLALRPLLLASSRRECSERAAASALVRETPGPLVGRGKAPEPP